jgi:hypothetical protein
MILQFYRLDDVTGGTTLIDTSTSVDLQYLTMLIATCGIGGLNATAGAAAIGLNRMYIESDY